MPKPLRFRSPLLLTLVCTPFYLTACSDGRPGNSGSRVTTETSDVSVAGIVTAHKETSVTEPVGSAPSDVDVPDAQPEPQAGILTAGDHDDLLNADQYARYAGRFLQSHGTGLPFVDTRTRVAIRVVDSVGRPVPFARVELQRDRAPLRLVTAVDGIVSVYRRFDSVSGRAKISVASAAGNVSRVVDLADSSSSRVDIAVPGTARPASAMDLVLVLDTTGSMGDEMAYLQAELDSIVTRLKREAGDLDLRIGVVVYRDEGDDYVVRSAPLTNNVPAIRSMLAKQDADGGGDTPEAVDQALAAAERMQWRPDSAKALLLVADAPPHDEALGTTMAATERLRSRGVQIVPVGASGVDETAEYMMRTMAAVTQGRYIFLTDDSGVGNPHQEPDVACYAVTHLDQLIGRVLAGIAKGRRIEPRQSEVIRMVGNYDRGRCHPSRAANQS